MAPLDSDRPSSPPSSRDGAELRRQFVEESWPAEIRYLRAGTALASAVLVVSWLTDVVMLGPVRLAFVLLGLRVLSGAMMIPLLACTWSRRRPARLRAAKLLAAAAPAVIVVIFTLKPANAATQGWSLVVFWSLLTLALPAPAWLKVATNGGTLALYGAHLAYMASRVGGGYARPGTVVPILLGAAFAIFALPWLPHRLEEQRFREFVARRRLEREVRLREERERALSAAKEAAEQAEREAHEQRERADRAAEEARREARLRAALFANMSHDLRTPMSGILGLVELLRGTRLTEEQAGYIETIRASNQALLARLTDVIDLTRIEEGKLPLAPAPVPLADTLAEPAEHLRASAARKGLPLDVELAAGLPRHVRLDPARVQQITLHLLANAIRFTERGAVTLRISTRDWHAGRGRLRVEVRDTGIGIPEERRLALFEGPRPSEGSPARRLGGSGLGLTIAKGLVALMSGTIGVESTPGGGSLFWFEIPVEEADEPSDHRGPAPIPALDVLLAEDNPVNQMVLSLMLEKLGQKVTVAGDGRRALHLLTRTGFDLAILDMQMPEMDGDEVTRRLRAVSGAASRTYVVALTAGAGPEEQSRYEQAGVDAFYTKPIDMTRLRRLLAIEGPRAMARSGLRRRAP